MLRRVAWLVCLALVLGLAISCRMPVSLSPLPVSPTPGDIVALPSPEMLERHQRVFQFVWEKTCDDYVYEDFNGVDWDAVRAEFEPRIAASSDDAQFWQLMKDVIARLDDEHSIYLTPDEAAEEDRIISGQMDYVGIGIYVTVSAAEDYGVVLLTFPGGPAERAGVLPHDRILTVDGVRVCCGDDSYDRLDLMQGAEGTTVRVTLQSPGESAREVQVRRARIQSQLPVTTRRFDGTASQSVGYILLPTFWDETIAERAREQLGALFAEGRLEGLIIDMRINGGGAYSELSDFLSLFISGEVGQFYERRKSSGSFTVAPHPIADSRDLPLVVLTGAATESYAEIFSGILQEQGRATLIGQPTAGNVETIYSFDLEDGSRLWLALETFTPPSGARWEGKGVQPDILVAGEWENFTDRDDPQLQAALEYFRRLPDSM